jgi:hypothetical protein
MDDQKGQERKGWGWSTSLYEIIRTEVARPEGKNLGLGSLTLWSVSLGGLLSGGHRAQASKPRARGQRPAYYAVLGSR